MPKPTFNRLPLEKRKDFEEASLNEFSQFTFEQASISNIVRTLGIAKGSVYQYFDDKLDLYEHLVTISSGKLHNVLSFVDERASDDAKLWFVQRSMAEIKFAQQFKSEYALLAITTHAQSKDLATLAQDLYGYEIERLTKALHRQGRFSESLVQIVYAVKEHYVRTYINTNQETGAERLYQFADIIFS